MTAQELYFEATKRGLRLEPVGDKLAVIPARLCPADFANVLRKHKGELLALLEAKSAMLAPDCGPWLYIARQVLAGEFDGANRSTVESLAIGLRGIVHPLCQQGVARLKNQRPNSSKP